MTKHTPPPWEVDVLGYLRGPNSENVLEIKENAEFIVSSVNCREEMTETLRIIKDFLESVSKECGPSFGGLSSNALFFAKKAEQAISKAAGQ